MPLCIPAFRQHQLSCHSREGGNPVTTDRREQLIAVVTGLPGQARQ
jgi:hypothetical protein